MEHEAPKRLAKLLARYTRDIELEDSTMAIYNLVSSDDTMDYNISDDFYRVSVFVQTKLLNDPNISANAMQWPCQWLIWESWS